MTTSGTVSTTTFETRKVVEHACRRCRIIPQKITPEVIETGLDLLYLLLSTYGAKGIALWCIQKVITPMYENVISVPMPVGTLDILNCNLRTPQRLTGTYSASTGVANNAFDGIITTACTQSAPGGFIQLINASGISAPNFGILPNVTGSWSIKVQGSFDGSTWVDLYVNTTFAAVAKQWQWFDVEGVLNYLSYRLLAVAPTTLDVTEFFVGNMGQSIPLYRLNRDDYWNLNDLTFAGRPVQYWYDKQRTQPILHLWPAPQPQFTFSQIVSLAQRYIQDIGTLQQEVEVPQRWYFAVVCDLARQLGRELPAETVDPSILPMLDMDAKESMANAWDGESDSSNSFFRPNLSPYTS